MTRTNAQYRLVARPVGLPRASDWKYVEEPAPNPGEGEFLVEVDYLSIDPAMRSWMNEGRSYVPPVGLGEVMRAAGIGHVVESHHPDHPVGEVVSGSFGVQRYAVCDGKGVTPVDLSLGEAPVHLGALGFSGLTAYFGLLDIGRPEPGQTVVVSAAAGSVGSLTGQIAKLKGCRVIGIAGGPDKCRFLVDELGFDGAVDYKAGSVRARLKDLAPNGVDVFFDNVGGQVLDDVLARLAHGARVVISGAVSQYNSTQGMSGPSNYMQLLVKRASMTGFVIFDYAARYGEARAELAEWLRSGRLKERTHVIEGGVERFPEALLGMFAGDNTGKLVLAL
ncbi:NADP-dependent oxidoreductase [Streptomyces sulfonofaciens]|uniref:NADP-dependent oxidoreductase n=1 Tax=Streptomyces sulfonofaciens TaxID=68272 RepID=A0A919G459_9ACTN|nr:NADP-dependent oxidoreductase [Streptomyces sulfonofaciens]GHH77208.1 NADP-dependent oxidoreductase [Streptomyces sulfonofaciens]